jgi:uncharacterized protein (DUF1778 family)
VAGTDQRRGAQVRTAATEDGSQPEKTSRKRSPKPAAHKRAYVCSVRLNDEEKTLLIAAARAVHTNLPAFLARSGLSAARNLDDTAAAIAGQRELVAELFAARRHLGHIGNNLNQVARAINSGGQPPELDAVIAAVHCAVRRVQDATNRLIDRE